jgi:hypothetical protein
MRRQQQQRSMEIRGGRRRSAGGRGRGWTGGARSRALFTRTGLRRRVLGRRGHDGCARTWIPGRWRFGERATTKGPATRPPPQTCTSLRPVRQIKLSAFPTCRRQSAFPPVSPVLYRLLRLRSCPRLHVSVLLPACSGCHGPSDSRVLTYPFHLSSTSCFTASTFSLTRRP